MPPELRNEIPFTQSRLKSLIKIKVSYGGYKTDILGGPPVMPPLTLIGALTQAEVKVMRGAAERRELNYDTMGKIIEMVPGLVTYDVKFKYVWLYAASFMEACGFAGHTLEYQTRPLMFELTLPSPDPAVLPEKKIQLLDCWLKDNPGTWDVEQKDDLRIVQDIDLACGGIREVP